MQGTSIQLIQLDVWHASWIGKDRSDMQASVPNDSIVRGGCYRYARIVERRPSYIIMGKAR